MIKRLIKCSSALFALSLAFMSVSAVFASESDKLTINGEAAVDVGDKITYTIYLADCENTIIGIQMYLCYDSEKLEYVEDSLEFEKFDGAIYNPDLEDVIPFNWTDLQSPADYSSKARLLKVEFEVKEAGEAEISEFITDMYGEDMTYIKNYTLTYDISSGGETIISDEPVIVAKDKDCLDGKSGDFINYDDAMGDNSPDSEDHQVVTQVVEKVVDVTSSENGEGSGSTVTVLVIAAAAVIILAIVAVLIVRKRDKSAVNSGEKKENTFAFDDFDE